MLLAPKSPETPAGGEQAVNQPKESDTGAPNAAQPPGPTGLPAGLMKRTMIGLAPGDFIVPKPESGEPPAPITKPGPGPLAIDHIAAEAKPGAAASETIACVALHAALTEAKPGPAAFQTIMGMAPDAVLAEAKPGPAAFQTMMGMAPDAVLTEAKPEPAAFQTMMGMAPDKPGAMAPVNEAKRTLLGAGYSATPGTAAPLPDRFKKETLIGVAIPGIAPINPGVDKAAQAQQSAPESPPPEPEPELTHAEIPMAFSGRRYLALTLAIAATVLATTCVVALWWWQSSPKLSVQIKTDESGRDHLEIDCTNCNDGSSIALRDSSTLFDNHHASIPLKQPLKMGDNSVQLLLSRRGARSESIQLHVPVDFRVAGDTSALDETTPKLRLLVDKSPNVTVEVHKQTPTYDTAGHGHFDVDVASDIMGQSAIEKPLERRVAYIARTSAGVVQGAVLMRIGILPLTVDTPGPLLMTDREDFKLCGTTAPGSQIDVAGLKIDVDSGGRFCHSMIIKDVGKFTIWITSAKKGYAPRKVQRVIARFANLHVYAKKLYKEVPHELATSATDSNTNSLVALTGTIVELSERPPVTRLLLQFGPNAGPQGVVRIVTASQPGIKAGQTITVFGQVTGVLKGPDGRDMSELSAAFILPGSP